jgi:hypothetical protein
VRRAAGLPALILLILVLYIFVRRRGEASFAL